MNSLTFAIVGHLVGDYLLQNDWMALNKKTSDFPCMIHALIWSLAVCAFAGWWDWLVFLALLSSHYWQDRTQVVKWWMTKVNRQQKFTEPPLAPWSLIVVDNVWHIVTLYVIARFLA